MASDDVIQKDDNDNYPIITYKQIVDYTLAFLKSKCCNIDRFPDNFPNELQNNKVIEINSESFSQTKASHGGNVVRTAHTTGVRGTVKDNLAVVVSSAKVEQDLNDFLDRRGIKIADKVKADPADNEIVSSKGIMNFFANVADFISAKLIYLSNSATEFHKSTGTYLFYNNANVAYPSNDFTSKDKINFNDLNFSEEDIKKCMTNLYDSLSNTTKSHNVNTVLSFYCCSCSSSSSSSSSSSCSSSSSSSSWFIAFMDI